MTGLGSSLVTGMAFGAGSEVAHNLVRGATGSGGQSYVETQERLPENTQTQIQPNQSQLNPCMNQI